MPKAQAVELSHTSMVEGRALMQDMDLTNLNIPSITAELSVRWRAMFKGKWFDPKENKMFLDEALRIISELKGISSQRSIYYMIRGAHPEWTYKDGPLGDEFYQHFISWVMEKAQLGTGLTMQAMGVWAAQRGYIAGDGFVTTSQRGRIPLAAKPALIFDIADEGMVLNTHAKKVIHFEKDAGFENLVSGSFPKYIEAIFSTSQGALTESATKFLRQAEDRGLELYAVHDGDPAGIQMQLMYGMASQNNCYMPSEFYPQLVKPLGFYPSIGEALGLPPEDVTSKEDGIFGNLLNLAREKQAEFPELRRFGMDKEVSVIVQQRKKWEFQALNAIHEAAPKIYLIEGLRVHDNEIKHVPDGEAIKASVLGALRPAAASVVENSIKVLAQRLYESTLEELLLTTLRETLKPQIGSFNNAVKEAMQELQDTPGDYFREAVKRKLLNSPALYAADAIKSLIKSALTASFTPQASLEAEITVKDIEAYVSVTARPPEELEAVTKTDLVDAIEALILPEYKEREKVVTRIRSALEERFGEANEEW